MWNAPEVDAFLDLIFEVRLKRELRRLDAVAELVASQAGGRKYTGDGGDLSQRRKGANSNATKRRNSHFTRRQY
jgi:hypothetical protein